MPLGTPIHRPSGSRLLAATLLGICVALAACAPAPAELEFTWDAAALPADPGDYHLPPPPLSEGVFPCSDCHDPEIPVNTQRREMKNAHQEIVLDHDEEHRWCLDCHDAGDRDQLHLASGELVAFEESHRLCGQCHGDKYRDWRAGVHGRRTGRWDGEKHYLLCVHCHDSHRPAFEPLEPMPAPEPPRRTP
jgi:hypothetical protein